MNCVILHPASSFECFRRDKYSVAACGMGSVPIAFVSECFRRSRQQRVLLGAWLLCVFLVHLNVLEEAEGSAGSKVPLYYVIIHLTLVLLNVKIGRGLCWWRGSCAFCLCS